MSSERKEDGGGGEELRKRGKEAERKIHKCSVVAILIFFSELTPVFLPSSLGFHGYFSILAYQYCLQIQPPVIMVHTRSLYEYLRNH